MRAITLLLSSLLFSVSANAVDVDFGAPIEGTLYVSTMTMTDEGMTITYSGEVGKYGLVHASHQYIPSNEAETQGHFTGTVQAIDDVGVIDRSFTAGLYSRDGSTLRVYGFDDDNANRIMWAADVDLRERTMNVKVWELDQ